jgi:hypothetical protein
VFLWEPQVRELELKNESAAGDRQFQMNLAFFGINNNKKFF